MTAVVTNNNFAADADVLHKAMHGMGTDEKALIGIIGSRSRADLHQIDQAYRVQFGNPLAHRIAGDTSGNFKQSLVNVVQTPDLTDAMYLHQSMAGAGTDESLLNEIMATRTAEEMEAIKMTYIEKYHSGLEKAIKGDTGGKYESLLLARLNINRARMPEAQPVNLDHAAADAQRIHDSPSDATFNQTIAVGNELHNLAVKSIFEQRYGTTLASHIKKKCSGHHEDLLLMLIVPRVEVLSGIAYASMKGLGTDEEKLVRVITTRYGVDLSAMKQFYSQKYGKSLFDHVKSEVSGNFGALLLELIAHS